VLLLLLLHTHTRCIAPTLCTGATIQVLLFAVMAVEIKRKAPTCHTVLEVVRVRRFTFFDFQGAWGARFIRVERQRLARGHETPLGTLLKPHAAAFLYANHRRRAGAPWLT
jgi:hypothetical protein